MATNVSDYLLERLGAWGVKRIYGFPGDGINGIMGALNRAKATMQFVQVAHEELAAFMATGHAKYTGQVGVCLATSGPGAIHLLNGLYDAKLDHAPVIAIVGQQKRTSLGGNYQQEVDLVSLYKDVAGEYVQMQTHPAQTRQLVDRAIRIAIAERTVTALIIPADIQELDAEEPARAHGTVHTGVGWTTPRVVPTEHDLRRAADVLNAGTKVAMLVGAGARGATEEVIAVADALGAGVAKALLGKDVLPDDLPWVTGPIGLLGTKPSWDLMADCDTLLMVGSSFPYSEFLPREGAARAVQIDLDGRMLGLRHPTEVNLVGDSAMTLRALLPLLRRKTERRWRETIEKGMAAWWRTLEARAMNDANPLNPQRVYWELDKRLSGDFILASDCGSVTNWYARDLRIRAGMKATLSGTLATMGPGVPYAIAAKFAFPDRPVIALVGDGAMQMNGINGLITIAKYWKEWKDPRLVVMVLNNRDLNQVTWEQRAMEGDPKFNASQQLADFPYAQYAQMLGLGGVFVKAPDEVGPAWDAALKADRPTVYEAFTDPEVPTLPPHITFEQARHFMSAMAHGDPRTGGMLRQTFRDAMSGLFPPGKG